jgi:hypothetical protein
MARAQTAIDSDVAAFKTRIAELGAKLKTEPAKK